MRTPMIGRPGRKMGTCELVLAPLPWVMVYVVSDDGVDIVRVLHGAQRWP